MTKHEIKEFYTFDNVDDAIKKFAELRTGKTKEIEVGDVYVWNVSKYHIFNIENDIADCIVYSNDRKYTINSFGVDYFIGLFKYGKSKIDIKQLFEVQDEINR